MHRLIPSWVDPTKPEKANRLHARNDIEANLRHHNGLLHVLISKDIVPHWVRERPGDVGTDVFRPVREKVGPESACCSNG